jgi:hypothetical protein
MNGASFMKKEWSRPTLEVLEVNMTMAGVGVQNPGGMIDDPYTPAPGDLFGS